MLFAPQTWPFTVATFLMLLIAIVEGIAMVVGASLSESLQSGCPIPGRCPRPFRQAARLAARRPRAGARPARAVPGGFRAHRLRAQHGHASLLRASGFRRSLSVPAAFFATLPIVRIFGAGLARLIPQDETYAVSFDTLVGRVATIVTGTARAGLSRPGESRERARPDALCDGRAGSGGHAFKSGERVLLTKQISGSRFAAS